MTSRTSSLRRTWDRLRTVPGLGRDVLVLLGLVLVGILTVALLLASSGVRPPWQGTFTLAAEFEQAPAVNPAAAQKVTIAGVRVGTITTWRVTDRGTAVVEMEIEPGHEVFDNARAVLRTQNALNQMYVEIAPGGPPGVPLAEGGVLPIGQTERPVQADEVLVHLDEDAQRALTAMLTESDTALAQAPELLPGGLRTVDRTLVDLEPVMSALQTRRDKISQLVTATSQIASAVGGNQQRAADLAASLQETLTVLARNDDDLRASVARLPGLGDQLRAGLTATQRLTTELDPTLRNLRAASDALPPALEDLTETAEQIGETVEQARPVVSMARPVVGDLRPLLADAHTALDDAVHVTRDLDPNTEIITSYLNDLNAFVYNTSSVFRLQDATGPVIRAHVVVPLPDGGALPGNRGGYRPGPEATSAPPPAAEPGDRRGTEGGQ